MPAIFFGSPARARHDHLVRECGRTTAAILRTRDGSLRADPIGTCRFLNDRTVDELSETLTMHTNLCLEYPRGGDGIDAFTTAEGAYV